MDAYASHLAKVNEVQDVVATDDIYNAQGQVLVKRGARINPQMVERITRFKLLKPLEHSVVIENELNSKLLNECFSVYIGSNESTAALMKQFTDSEELQKYCEYFCQFPLLRQKLTVLSLSLPSVFEQAMFCAWMGVILAKQMPAGQIDPREFFVAALCHDIGMVHINGEILNKSHALSLEEWRQIQSHPIIGFNIVKETSGINAVTAKAILEHHENLDGTGYPRGKLGAMLGREGQLLNLLDSVNAIFNKHFKPNKRSLRELIPIIQMNQRSRFSLAANYLVLLLRELPPTDKHAIPNDFIGETIDFVKQRNGYIAKCTEICMQLTDAVGFRHDDPKLASVQNAIIHITLSIAQSGIINDAYIRWLDLVNEKKLTHAYKEVEEAYLMMQEIIYHIEKLKRQIQLLLESKLPGNFTAALTQGLLQLNQTPLPQTNENLAKIWMFTV